MYTYTKADKAFLEMSSKCADCNRMVAAIPPGRLINLGPALIPRLRKAHRYYHKMKLGKLNVNELYGG